MQNINISVCTVFLPGVESVQSVVAETFEITAITNFVDGFYWSFERRFAKISKSWRRPLLGPSPGLKSLLVL